MNQTLETIAKRYTCRSFTDKAVGDADLKAIAVAALQAPTGMNRQHFQVIVIKSKAVLEELEKEGMRLLSTMPDKGLYERIRSRGGKLFYNAPCMMFLAIKEAQPKGSERVDMGIVAQNISLAATSLGIDNCLCGLVALCFTGERADEFKQMLQFPSGYECGIGVLLGYGTAPGTPHEPNFDKITIIE